MPERLTPRAFSAFMPMWKSAKMPGKNGGREPRRRKKEAHAKKSFFFSANIFSHFHGKCKKKQRKSLPAAFIDSQGGSRKRAVSAYPHNPQSLLSQTVESTNTGDIRVLCDNWEKYADFIPEETKTFPQRDSRKEKRDFPAPGLESARGFHYNVKCVRLGA